MRTGGDEGTAEPGAWLGRLLADEEARSRARARWLAHQAAAEGTFAGVLADLAERDRPIAVQLANGRIHHGTIAVLGADLVVLRPASGRDVLLQLAAVTSVRTVPGETPTVGDRHVVRELTFADALGALAIEGARVLVVAGPDVPAISGEVRAVGRDVVSVRLDGGGGTAYVALASVAEVSLLESG